MAIETSSSTFRNLAVPRTRAETRQGTRPVQIWGAIGALFVALQTYIIGSWLLSGHATPTDAGPTPIPSLMQTGLWIHQGTSIIFFALMVWFFLIRPWRREGGLTVDGMMVIGFILVAWQDPLLNYTQVYATYNAGMINLGSWTSDVPGWLSPNGHLLPEPFLWGTLSYVWAAFGGVVLANKLMAKAQRRWPSCGTIRLLAFTYAIFFIVDIIFETGWMYTGVYEYPGSAPGLTLWAGHYYQFPIMEAVLFSALITAWSALRYFKNDKGETIAQRGIDEVRVSGKRKSVLQVLALAGVINVMFLMIYNVPAQVVSMHGGAWPKDLQERSYLTDGMCGPGTDYKCPGPGTPLPRGDGSGHVNPAGQFVPAK